MGLNARAREPIRVLLVDHPGLSRYGLVALLARRRGAAGDRRADNGLAALSLARAAQPDVVIVDTTVPDAGLKVVTDLCRELHGCAILVLTPQTSDDAVSEALQAGARGYLQKSCEPEDLVCTIERIHLGEIVVAAQTSSVRNGLVRSPGAPDELTKRELEVLRLVPRGRTNPSIARPTSRGLRCDIRRWWRSAASIV